MQKDCVLVETLAIRLTSAAGPVISAFPAEQCTHGFFFLLEKQGCTDMLNNLRPSVGSANLKHVNSFLLSAQNLHLFQQGILLGCDAMLTGKMPTELNTSASLDHFMRKSNANTDTDLTTS